MPLPTPLPSEYTKPATFGGGDQEEPKPPKQKPYTPPKRSDYDRIKAKPESDWTEAEKKYMAGQQAINLGREAEGVAKSKIGLYDPYIVDLLGDVQEEGARMKKLPGEFQRAGSQALAGAMGQAGLGGAAMTPGAVLVGSQVAGDMQTRASEAERAAAAQIRELEQAVMEGRLDKNEAEIEARNIGRQLQQDIMDAPVLGDFKAEAAADAEGQWQAALSRHKGAWYEDDNEAGVWNDIIGYLDENVEDPEVMATYRRKACSVIDSSDGGAKYCQQWGYPVDKYDF